MKGCAFSDGVSAGSVCSGSNRGDLHQRTSVGKETVPQPSVTHVWVTADVKHGLLTGPDESKDALGPGLQKCVDTTPRGTCY